MQQTSAFFSLMSGKIQTLIRGRRPSGEIQDIAKEIDKKNIEGFFSHEEGELLYYLAAGCPKNATIVEIGSWKGRSTCWMGKASKNYSQAKIYAIDPHIGSPEHQGKDPVNTFQQFEKNLKKLDVFNRVTSIVKFSHQAINDIKEEIDLLFIDGAHEYEAVKKDFDLWFPKLREGGIIAFHDSVGKGWPGVHRLIKEKIFSSQNFRDIRFIGTITFATKIQQNSFWQRRKNSLIQTLKALHEIRKTMPKAYRNLEHHLIKRRIQRRWIHHLMKKVI